VPLILLGARLALAIVLGVAGIAKLLDAAGTRAALAGFEVPPRWAAPLGVALPAAELLVAAALLPAASAWYGALGALALLALFTAAIGRALRRGARPDCRCFGQLRPRPVGRATLVRNTVLMALALLVLIPGPAAAGPGLLGWLEPLAPGERAFALVGAVTVALLGALVVMVARLLGQQARLLARLEAIEDQLEGGAPAPATEREEARPPARGLPVGAAAPAFALPDLDGVPRSLAALLAPSRPVLLVFASAGCEPCAALAPEIGRWQRQHAAVLTVAVVSSGGADENRAKLRGVAPDRVLLQAGSEVADAYTATWTPGAVLIGRAGRIASAMAYGDRGIGALVARAAAAPHAPVLDLAAEARPPGQLSLARKGPPGPGDPAPPLTGADLDGRTIDLADYRGRDTLVVFWQPNCPHCQRLAEDLRRWEAEPPRGAPRLLIVSAGDPAANRALGFRSPVVLDEGFAIGKAFGARGTPSAVLVDAQGRIASTVGVGARDVLALAGALPPVRAGGAAPAP
jgi:peroxiredoxin